jgi:predicted GIY-YIG superfamily endonuclease
VPALAARPTALYRLKDAAGRLLYVGITTDPEARFKRHEGTAPWWPLVAERTVDWHATRPIAEKAEATAIKGEAPLYNRAGSDAPQSLAEDFPVGREVSMNQLRLRLADVLHASAVEGRTTYITSNGRRIAAIAPLDVADATT